MKVELVSYSSSLEIMKSIPSKAVEEILSHTSFTFIIEGVSRACSHQLVRHRVASYSQQSQRYVEVKNLVKHVVVPKSIEENSKEMFMEYILMGAKVYETLVGLGISKEDARFVLPNATETNLILTMDGRGLLHFFGLRCCNRAQWEIKTLADLMLSKVREVEPKLFSKAGPYCFQLGYCPEGRFSCGRIKEVQEKYKTL
ncbi:FAD-dependent thymidylate synthase [Candidatus Bathyarchaeota archaeon]|nr:FAD-dependent thymidylate synthase [Candidatus Bathyarchaeota archaeon]MBS7631372.1 FAD-dependent thymidylate synthase [Candidatus Bathyarchaeota archaeon]